VDPADQVLGRVDLHRLPDGERRTHAVGADLVLRPDRAFGQSDPVGLAPYIGRTLAPEDHPLGVGDDHDVRGLVGDRGQRLAQYRQDGAERVVLADAFDGVGVDDHRRRVQAGIDRGGQRPLPGRRDQRARSVGHPAAAEHLVVQLAQPAGLLRCVHPASLRVATFMQRHAT
jgi:hypothetical protein